MDELWFCRVFTKPRHRRPAFFERRSLPVDFRRNSIEPLRTPQLPTHYTQDDLHIRQFMTDTSRRLLRKGQFKAA